MNFHIDERSWGILSFHWVLTLNNWQWNWTNFKSTVLWVHTNGNVIIWLSYWNPNWMFGLKNPFRVSFIWIGCMHFEVLKLLIETLVGFQTVCPHKWSLGWTTKTRVEPKLGLQLRVFICIHVKTYFSYWGLWFIGISIMVFYSYIWITEYLR